jgi:hypothetical protein
VEAEEKQPLSPTKKSEIFAAVVGKTAKQAQTLFTELNPIASLPNNKEKLLTPKHTQLQIVVEQETLELLQEVKALLSHEIPDGNFNQILKRMAQLSIEALQKKKGRSQPQSKNGVESPVAHLNLREQQEASEGPPVKAPLEKDTTDFAHRSESQCKKSRYITHETKRKVFHRANGQCEFVSAEGKRCESRHRLELDHQVAWSLGGGNDESNLLAHCRSHNSFRTMETHGFWWKPKQEKSPS